MKRVTGLGTCTPDEHGWANVDMDSYGDVATISLTFQNKPIYIMRAPLNGVLYNRQRPRFFEEAPLNAVPESKVPAQLTAAPSSS